MHLSMDLLLLDILIFVQIKNEICVQLKLGMQVPKTLVIQVKLRHKAPCMSVDSVP